MKLLALTSLLALAPILTFTSAPQDEPTLHHKWLQQLVGEWHAEVDDPTLEPAVEPERVQVLDSIRGIGNYWVVSESQVSFSTGAVHYMMTLGFDPDGDQFIGTWVDSTSNYLWSYTGSLDEGRKVLTLHAKGPGPDGEPVRYRDEIELMGADQKTHRNFTEGENGEWVPLGEVTFRRKR